MPQTYGQHIPQFDKAGPITSQQHIDKMSEFSDLEEEDDDDVKMRLFAQSLVGEVRKWFRGFPMHSIADMAYQLRESNLATLEEMQRNVVLVEENLFAKR